MDRVIYRYQFADNLPLEDVEAEILLAIFSAESLHGAVRARLEAGHFLDLEQRTLVIDATSEVGEDFNRLFVGGLMRDRGPEVFQVTRLVNPPKQERNACQA